MSTTTAPEKPHRPFLGHMIRVFSLPVIVFWVLAAVALGALVPSLDEVAATRSVPISPTNAPSYQAMLNIGKVFQEYDSDSSAMVVLESDDQLGDAAHAFYDKGEPSFINSVLDRVARQARPSDRK